MQQKDKLKLLWTGIGNTLSRRYTMCAKKAADLQSGCQERKLASMPYGIYLLCMWHPLCLNLQLLYGHRQVAHQARLQMRAMKALICKEDITNLICLNALWNVLLCMWNPLCFNMLYACSQTAHASGAHATGRKILSRATILKPDIGDTSSRTYEMCAKRAADLQSGCHKRKLVAMTYGMYLLCMWHPLCFNLHLRYCQA